MDPPDTDLGAWKRIQDALPFDTKGDVLKPPEVRTVRRFLLRGEEIDWIPQSGDMTPTHDFLWTPPGLDGLKDGNPVPLEIEMKSAKNRYSTIAEAVRDAVSRARDNEFAPVLKENFIIDIGVRYLTTKLRDQLAKYNARNPGNRIKRMWVMSSDGAQLARIDLE